MNKEYKLIITLLVSTLAAIALIVALEGSPVYADPDPGAPQLLLSEICVTPTEGEFIEIYNPGDTTVDLSDVYLTDATFAGGDTYYYGIVTGGGGGGGFWDFHARFPDGATIASGVYQTIALSGSNAFIGEYGIAPTYELYEDGASADSVPDMREATIWLAVAKDKETVAINRGENRGKEITYSHPVLDLMPIGMWKGEKMLLRLPLKDLQTKGGDCLVAMLQVEGSGPILGAAAYERK